MKQLLPLFIFFSCMACIKETSSSDSTLKVKIPNWDIKGDVAYDIYELSTENTDINDKEALPVILTIEKLFEIKSNFTGDNKTYNGLTLDDYVLKDKRFNLYLKGSWMPAGDMSGAYMKNNVELSIFQYKMIDTLVVYLNQKKFDWCMDDLSGGENGCPEETRLWISTRE